MNYVLLYRSYGGVTLVSGGRVVELGACDAAAAESNMNLKLLCFVKYLITLYNYEGRHFAAPLGRAQPEVEQRRSLCRK